jgi:hypothetical protein
MSRPDADACSAREADERCLAVLMLLHDGRSVEPDLAAWARAHAAAHPACAAAHAGLVELSAALAATPPLAARPGFTARVLSALAAGRADGVAQGDVLPFVRRLAVAAGLALALTLFVEMARPSDVQADAALQRERHAADHFRRGAFGPQDIEAGLRGRLKDPDADFRGLPAEGGQAPGGERR